MPRAVEEVIAKTNDFRRRHPRHPVVSNAELTKAAEYYAKYLADKDVLSHTADGQEPWDRARNTATITASSRRTSPTSSSSAGFTTDALAEAFVNGWENSPGHRKNMLNRYVTDTGVAVARNESSGKYYAVQMFGRPKSAEVEFQIVNDTDTAVKYKVDQQALTVEPRVRMTHRACTPPDLRFELPAKEQVPVFHPEKGSRYVLRPSQGAVTVSEEKK